LSFFPNPGRIDEAYNYLVMAYMNTRNYREALISIEKIRVQTNDIRRATRGLPIFGDWSFTVI
jgi:hypothetical protein